MPAIEQPDEQDQSAPQDDRLDHVHPFERDIPPQQAHGENDRHRERPQAVVHQRQLGHPERNQPLPNREVRSAGRRFEKLDPSRGMRLGDRFDQAHARL